MAIQVISRNFCAGLLKSGPKIVYPKVNNFSTGSKVASKKLWILGLGTVVGVTGGLFYAIDSIDASDPKAIPSKLGIWTHQKLLYGYDHASMRRGYEVYKTVCASCHSLKYVAYRHLINQTHTEDEAKAEAAESTVIDGPDDMGNMFERPGRLTDYIVGPYKNEQEARFANNGALPPDLSLIVLARKDGENYIFHLLTNYTDPPAGIQVGEGQAYNAYFPGGAIGMPQILFNGIVDYSDGTPSSIAQMAKDVVVFLSWCGDRQLEDRKKIGMIAIPFLCVMFVCSWYYTRFVFKPIKSRSMWFVERIRKSKQ